MTTTATPLPLLQFINESLRQLSPLIARVQTRDRSLADQMRRAAASVALNIAEAKGVALGNKRVRVETALGSARETIATIDVADAFGYGSAPEVRARFDEIVRRIYGWYRRL